MEEKSTTLPGGKSVALKIAGIYYLFALGWIYCTDLLLSALVADSLVLTRFQTWKGSVFALATAVLVFGLTRHYLREVRERDRIYLGAARQVADAVGDEYFYRLCEQLCALTRVTHALVSLLEPDGRTARVISGVGRGKRMAGFGYDLENTPCARVLQEEICICSRDVQRHFPKDEALARMGIQGYMGIRLQAPSGQVLGLLTLLHDAPLTRTDQKEAGLRLFALRTAAELQRLQAGLQVEKSEQRLRSLIEGSLQGIIVHRASRPLYVNLTAARMFGFASPSDLKTFDDTLELVASEDRERILEYFAMRRQGEAQPEHLEFRGLRRDGRRIWVESRNILIDWEDGPAYFSSLHDLSYRRSVEESLRQSEERFRVLLDTVTDSIFLHDLKGRIRDINSRAVQSLGYSREELLRLRVQDIELNPAKLDLDAAWRQMEEGRTLTLNGMHQRKDGVSFPVEVGLAPFTQAGEKLILATVRDIGPRFRAEEELRRGEARYRQLSLEFQALLNGIPDSINLLNPELDVIWANRGSLRHHHKADDQLFGRRCHELWYGKSAPCNDCPALRCFRSGKTVRSERRDDEGRIWELRYFPVFSETAEVENIIELASDVTETRRLKEESLRNAQLASLGEMAAGVAHEVNNPINGIINLAQLLLDDLQDPSLRDMARRILSEGDRIASIVQGLLTFARQEKQHKTGVDLTACLKETLLLVEAQLQNDAVLLELNLAQELPEVPAIRQQLQQVLLNLISNARYALNEKYPGAHPDKSLLIETERLAEPARVLIRVRDSGTGIPAEVLQRVLEPFFTTKPVHLGTGLGLSISHGIVREHGGELQIDSRENRYTEVRVLLPLASDPLQGAEA